MSLKYKQSGAELIVYDGEVLDQPSALLFEPDYWLKRSAVRAVARGRGNALVLDTEFGPAVLRVYRRGGWASKVSSRRYLFTGFERSRSVVEFKLLSRLAGMGLPVPRPLAAQCVRKGLSYTAALLTREISNATPLADRLGTLDCSDRVWTDVGVCIRRFHDAGVVHADLNARNILLSEAQGRNHEVYLIDFDRGRLGPRTINASRANLKRLHRSFGKLWPPADFGDLESCWERLLEGYYSAGSEGSTA